MVRFRSAHHISGCEAGDRFPGPFKRWISWASTVRTYSVEDVNINLYREGGDVADDKYLWHLMGVHFRVFLTVMGDEAAIEDAVGSKKRNW